MRHRFKIFLLSVTFFLRQFAVDLLTSLSKQHNDRLRQNIMEWQSQYPDVRWIHLDVGEMFEDILNAPERYGFTNTTGTCYEEMIDEPSSQTVLKMVSRVIPGTRKDACTGYLFFDPVHPVGLAHQIMAERSKILLDAAGIEFK